MTAFDAAIDAMFDDPNIGADALWRTGGAGDSLPVRVVVRRPQEEVGYRDTRFGLPAMLIDVRLSEVAPAKGDTVEIAGAGLYEIINLGLLDSGGFIRTCEAAPVAP